MSNVGNQMLSAIHFFSFYKLFVYLRKTEWRLRVKKLENRQKDRKIQKTEWRLLGEYKNKSKKYRNNLNRNRNIE